MRLFAAVVLPLFVVPVGRSADLPRVLAVIDQTATCFKSVTADVKKVNHWAFMNEDEIETGTIAVKRPRPKQLRALFVIKSPSPMQAALTETTLERYIPKMNVIEVYEIDKKYNGLAERYLLLGFGASSQELRQAYHIAYGGSETLAGKKTTKLSFTPKIADKALKLTKAEVWYSDELGIAVQQKFFFGPENDLLVMYSNVKLNPELPDSAVMLSAPKNAKKEYPLK